MVESKLTLNVNYDSIILYQTIIVVMSYVEVFRIDLNGLFMRIKYLDGIS